MITRRGLLEAAGGTLALTAAGPAWSGGAGEEPGEAILSPLLPAGTRAEAVLDTLPGKKPLIKLTYRPPNYEAPLAYLRTAITPNDEFFVRYHLTDIPQVDASSWKLSLGGEGANGEVQIGLDELKKLPAFEVVAVCQCAGNRRGLVQPHAAGVQWGSGAMGCARWKGARLKDVLDLVGLKKDAVEIVFDGADGPAIDKTPDFVKSLPVWKAIEETTLVAYEMRGEALPHWNGFPARIVVPGWIATYWVKHVTKISAVTKPFDGFWMKTGYRIPVGKFPLVQRFISQETAANTPITEMVVNSLISSPNDGARVEAGRKSAISGIAWDGGYGMSAIEVSADGGKSWTQAELGEDPGKFAFRPWRYDFMPKARGKLSLTARATNKIGQTQTKELIQNPTGYHHNV
ncbi:MAG: molybdopterin-dependent oxidoreductase, partial [Methylocella sp.]